MRPWSFRDKRDRVRQLRIFCEVVRAGTISGASERLGLTQPAVSLQVRDLEHEHGAILLERRSTGIGVTPAGRQLFALVEPLVQGVDGIFEDLPQSLGGPLAGGDSPPFVKRRTSHPAHAHAAFASARRSGLNRVWLSSMAQATPSNRSPTLRSARAWPCPRARRARYLARLTGSR